MRKPHAARRPGARLVRDRRDLRRRHSRAGEADPARRQQDQRPRDLRYPGPRRPARRADSLEGTGFDDATFGDLLDELAPEPPADDEPPALPEEPETRPGELVVLGDHRLVCADARDPESYARLMRDEQAELLWTDPPYGVRYQGKTEKALRIDNDGAAGLKALLSESFACAGHDPPAGSARNADTPAACPSAPGARLKTPGARLEVMGDPVAQAAPSRTGRSSPARQKPRTRPASGG